ncbi:hypothetical protein [Thiocapsa sp.]|uniref:hypothetical protein n=1 Tax=Thiocapsa sp. TaxID=2024551 RepID=UPI003593D2CD
MDGNSLKAIEFYGFMALAAWLVYSQFIASRRDRGQDRDRDRPDESPSNASERDNDKPPRG